MWKKAYLFILTCWILIAHAQPPVMPINIGAIYNLTGRQSLLDTYSANGANLAVTEINSAGGVLGRPLQLIVLNGETEPEVIANDAKVLGMNKNIVAVIGLSDTDMAIAAIPMLAKYHKLFITSGATAPILTKLTPGWVFLATFSDDQQAQKAADFAFTTQHYKTAVVLVQKDSHYATLLAKYFQANYEKLGGKILNIHEFRRDQLDISSAVQEIKDGAVQPDFIYLAVGPATGLQIIQQIRQMGIEQVIIGGDGLDTLALRQQAAAGHWPGSIYYTTHAFIDKANPNIRVQNFIEDYQRAFHHFPDTSFAALGYDTINLLAKAITGADSTDPGKIRAVLKNIQDFEGITGFMTFSNSYIPKKTITLIQLQNGEANIIR